LSNQSTLSIQLHQEKTTVSYLSSLLRVLQAAIREVARGNDITRQMLDESPQPQLILSKMGVDEGLTLFLTFALPLDSTPLDELSSQTFDSFLRSFAEFVKRLPQPSLWGGAAPGMSHGGLDLESQLDRRLDQVYRELRRSNSTTVNFGGRTIEIEGDRMEIG